MKAVLVVEVEFAPSVQVMSALQARFAEVIDGVMREHPRKVHLAIDDQAELVLSVFEEPGPGVGLHTVVVAMDDYAWAPGWTLEHSLACRRHGLSDCTVHAALMGLGTEMVMDRDDGRYRVELIEHAGHPVLFFHPEED